MGINAFYFKTKIAWLTLYKLILSNLAISLSYGVFLHVFSFAQFEILLFSSNSVEKVILYSRNK